MKKKTEKITFFPYSFMVVFPGIRLPLTPFNSVDLVHKIVQKDNSKILFCRSCSRFLNIRVKSVLFHVQDELIEQS